MRKKIARLLLNFVPEQYDLNLKLDHAGMAFSGTVIITGQKVGRPSKRLTFHQRDLNIKSVKVNYFSKSSQVALKVGRINKHKTFDELRIHFDQLIYPGKYQVEIEFAGTITKRMEGIYPCFFSEKGKEKKIIATQFESHHAREAFPCIDEPEAKAIFNLSLDSDNVTAVISNTEVKDQKLVKNRLITIFEPTPRMSTYLLAFVAGDLKYLETKTENDVRVRSYATADNVEFTKFALETASKTLDFYTAYYGIAFPLPKCDLVALPDFSTGAMENWGCITFREQALLVDPANTSLGSKQFIANVVAHELAHQWFGNLVTMKWWNDLWLNESFASWMSYLAVDKLYPDWNVWTQFIFDEQEKALQADALGNTHPIEVAINHPDEIRSIFDAISYEKGASVIAMLNSYLGPELFQSGINLYLKSHAYGNSTTIDLWRALEKASKKEVSQFMHKWITLGGYPLVKLLSEDNKTRISQSRFYLDPKSPEDKNIWPIPVHLEGKKDQIKLFYKRSALLDSQVIKPTSRINHDRQGFYRIVYEEEELLKYLDKELKHLSAVDRLAILSDHSEAAKAGHTETVLVLKLLSYFRDEDQLVVWYTIASFIHSIRLSMNDNELRESMKPFIRQFVSHQLKRLGFVEKTNDSHFDKLLRPLIIGLAALADDPNVLKWVKTEYAKGKIHPDYKIVVYSTIARLGGEKEYDELLKLHNQSKSPEDRINIAVALTRFTQPELIKRSLALIKSDKVKLQDAFTWLINSFYNHDARDFTWEWFKENWQWLVDNFDKDISLASIPVAIAKCYSDSESLRDFKLFFLQHPRPSLDRSVKQGIETIEWKAAWKKRDLKSIKEFFS